MKLRHPRHRFLVPDDTPMPKATARVTHLGIGAHQDDLEFMATHGILTCFQDRNQWFGGITCTDGAGSSRSGSYADYSDAEMHRVRAEEQEQAAIVGRYGFMAQLGYPSAEIKDPNRKDPVEDLAAILAAARPAVVYTHNPTDKHGTHVAVFAKVIRAIRSLPADQRPAQLLGCEVWRGLDWMPDSEKVALDVSGHDSLVAALNGIFDSQIAGGKRYDLAVEGRKVANATFFDSHAADTSDRVWYAMDLTPLIQDDSRSVEEFTMGFLDRLRSSVAENLSQFLG